MTYNTFVSVKYDVISVSQTDIDAMPSLETIIVVKITETPFAE
jgi:hypothetical protein